MSAPPFLKEPSTTPVKRLYHGSYVQLWHGVVRLLDVQGWAKNPRLELEMKKWKSDFGDQEINQDALYQMMKNTRHIRLKELADDIRVNGLREPIVLTFAGKLLDGNRRFFAVKLAHDTANDPAKKQELEMIPAFVLMENATDRDQQNILVEENFSPSLKMEWPDYVKAEHIRRAHRDEGLSVKDIAASFGWSTTKVRDTLKIGEITDEFISYVTGDASSEEGGLGMSDLDAEKVAADNYQFFNEAKKSFHDALFSDSDFAELFYKRVAQGDFFSRWDEVRCAHQGYNDPIGRPLLEKGDAGSGKDLKALIQMQKSILKQHQSIEERIKEFIKLLKELTAEEMKGISEDSYKNLQDALALVQKLVETAKNKK